MSAVGFARYVKYCLLAWCLGAMWAHAEEETGLAATSPSHLSPGSDMILLTVDKTTLHAHLRTLPEMLVDSQLLHSFRIAIGKETGDKEREGDHRTPEGIYFAQQHINTNKLLPTKYGPRSIPLDFPNLIDRRDGKTGYGIWLHGAGNDNRIADAQVTEGCVAFYNADILKLKSWLQPNQGIVVIAKDVSEINREDDIKTLHQLTLGWIEAWSRRQVNNYLQYYHPAFQMGGQNFQAYSAYKQRVFRSYKKITIKVDHLRVLSHPKYAVSIMNQDFSGDERFRSLGRKILYWQRTPEGWKITREHFDQKLFMPLSYSASDLANLRAISLSRTASNK